MSHEHHKHKFAVVCTHVLDGKYPALAAVRSAPMSESDSGWQVHCDVKGKKHNVRTGKLVCIGCLSDMLPDLAPWLNDPNTGRLVVSRVNTSGAWAVETA